MTTEVEEKTVFKFTELSDSAKESAIERYAMPDYDWWDDTIDDYKSDPDVKAKGYDIDEIYFSGFSSQGDGACWKGRVFLKPWITTHMVAPEDAVKREILLALIEEGWISSSAKITTAGRYSHSYTMSIDDIPQYTEDNDGDGLLAIEGLFKDARVGDLFDAIGGQAAIDALEADILSACRELADTIYSDLESEHDGYFEEDAFADTAAVNEWEFDENGVLI